MVLDTYILQYSVGQIELYQGQIVIFIKQCIIPDKCNNITNKQNCISDTYNKFLYYAFILKVLTPILRASLEEPLLLENMNMKITL